MPERPSVIERRCHPSGRPLHRSVVKGRPLWRIPDRGPVTPRLQEPAAKDAIGFHRVVTRDDDE